MMFSEQEMAEKLEKLRKPFDADQIEKLPKYTGKKDANGRIPKGAYANCRECGRYHPLPAVHLDYVGHAETTTRLNEVDPYWQLEPMAYNQAGLPVFDSNGGLWCWITILGIKRMCYGDSGGKSGPDAIKEAIGDAIRNGAMRFGVATYLWSRSERSEGMKQHQDTTEAETAPQPGSERAHITELDVAKQAAWAAIKEYAAKHGVSADATWAGVGSRQSYAEHKDDPAWYIALADEFRANA